MGRGGGDKGRQGEGKARGREGKEKYYITLFQKIKLGGKTVGST